MDNNFTHILCVKVWSPYLKMTSNYGNILSIVKNYITDTTFHSLSEVNGQDMIINWKLKQFEEPYNELFSGDLVANISLQIEDKLYGLTKELLTSIEEKLKNENKLQNCEKILFTIVRNIS
jgi:hypothetical protein